MMIWERYSVEQWLRLYTAVLVAATVGSLAIAAFQGQTVLYKPYLRFSDFSVYMEKTKHPFGNAEAIVSKPPQMNYPAPAVLAYSAFANLPGDPLSWFAGCILLAATFGVLLIEKVLARAGIGAWTRWTFAAATLLTSYPLWVEIDRANIEGLLWIFVIIGMYFFARKRFLLSGVCIALASTIKPFPLIIFVLFLAHALYRELIVSVLVWTSVTISAFLVTSGTLTAAIRHYGAGTSAYHGAIAVGYKAFESNFDHSLFCAAKQLCRVGAGFRGEEAMSGFLAAIYLPYMALAAFGTLACCYLLRRKPLPNQILGVFTLMVLVPPSNYDYTLLNLYVPFVFFLSFLVVDVTRESSLFPEWAIGALLFCFAILFTSQIFMHLNRVGFGGQIKAVALIAVLIIALKIPMRTAFWEETFVSQRPAAEHLTAGELV